MVLISFSCFSYFVHSLTHSLQYGTEATDLCFSCFVRIVQNAISKYKLKCFIVIFFFQFFSLELYDHIFVQVFERFKRFQFVFFFSFFCNLTNQFKCKRSINFGTVCQTHILEKASNACFDDDGYQIYCHEIGRENASHFAAHSRRCVALSKE